MINAEKIIFEKQNYYTPSWSGVTTVKILEVLPKGKVRVKAGESIFVRSIQYMFNTAKAAQANRRECEYSCALKSHFRKFGNQSSGTRKSPILCLMTYPFLLGYLSRPCRICGA